MKKLIPLMFSLLVCLGLCACSSQTETKEPVTYQLTAQDAGSTVRMSVGDALMITLAGNPTTGYTWEVAEINKKIIQQVGEPAYGPASNAIGVGGQYVFAFTAAAAGRSDLKLIYHRTFEDNPPEETFPITIVVE